MKRTKRAFYATDAEYQEFLEYAQGKERSISEFARYAMKAEISKSRNRANNRRKKPKT